MIQKNDAWLVLCGLLVYCLFLGSCKTPACTCDEFPFPSACESQCESSLATVKSVDPKNHTAVVEIRQGSQTEEKTISLAELPVSQVPEKGSQFRVLAKKDATAPKNPRIVRFVKEPPQK